MYYIDSSQSTVIQFETVIDQSTLQNTKYQQMQPSFHIHGFAYSGLSC